MVKIPAMKKPIAPGAVDVDALMDQVMKKPSASGVSESGEVVVMREEGVTTEAQQRPAQPLPWESANDRVISFFQIRMPEPLKLKIEWLAVRNFGDGKSSQHKIALKALEREIDRMIAREVKAK